MKTLLINIHQLLQIRDQEVSKVSGAAMSEMPLYSDAWLLINDGLIEDFGPMATVPKADKNNTIDCYGRIVLPTWCDSHTHLIYAGNRVDEFVMRLEGMSYEDIANSGGGILNSAKRLNMCSEDHLFKQAKERLLKCAKMGTGAIEIKSGYGLTLEGEKKMLRVAQRLKHEYPVTIKTTFLGAHTLPEPFRKNKEDYVDLVCQGMIPEIASSKLADYVDVFCEQGYFDLADTERILSVAQRYGLQGKIHVNQFNAFGGVALGVAMNALSVDHLEQLDESDLDALSDSQTMPVALPGCSLFLDIPFTPARTIIDHGLPLAIATDFNPGSAPSGNMNLVVSLACIRMKMTPAEAVNAATLNGAYAMGLDTTHGSITRGKVANLIITQPMEDYSHIAYNFGENKVDQVIIKGQLI